MIVVSLHQKQQGLLRLAAYSPGKSYVHHIREFILFHNKQHPREMGVAEIRAYLSHLAVEKNVAASIQTVALSDSLFLYRNVAQSYAESDRIASAT